MLLTSSRSARTLRSGSAWAHPCPHSSLAAYATEQAGLWLFENLDLGVITVDAQVSESSIGGLFN
jgi:hypothetical protein